MTILAALFNIFKSFKTEQDSFEIYKYWDTKALKIKNYKSTSSGMHIYLEAFQNELKI